MWRFQQWNRDSLLQLWLNPGFLQWKQSPVLWPLWPALPRLVKTPGIWSGYPLSPGPPCGTLPSSSGTRRFELTLAKGCTESAWCSSDKAWNKLQLQKNLRGSSRCFGWESGHQTRWSYCCWTAGCCETKKNKKNKTKPNFQQPKGTVGKNHSTHSTFKACRDFKKRIVEKGSHQEGGHSPEVLHWTITIEIREVAAAMNELVLQKEWIRWAD